MERRAFARSVTWWYLTKDGSVDPSVHDGGTIAHMSGIASFSPLYPTIILHVPLASSVATQGSLKDFDVFIIISAPSNC